MRFLVVKASDAVVLRNEHRWRSYQILARFVIIEADDPYAEQLREIYQEHGLYLAEFDDSASAHQYVERYDHA